MHSLDEIIFSFIQQTFLHSTLELQRYNLRKQLINKRTQTETGMMKDQAGAFKHSQTRSQQVNT